MPNPRDPKPLTPSEKWTFGVFLGLMLAGFLAEIVRDFHPVKLSVLFVALWWIPLLALHEAGHALMARALGWGVRRVVIGFGRRIHRFQWGGAEVEIRLAPVSGFVQSYPRGDRWHRLKDTLIYAAGPGSELVVAGLIVLVVGWDALTTVGDSVPFLVIQSLALAAATQAAINLVPAMVPDPGDAVGRRFTPTDGMGMLFAWRNDPLYYRQQAALWRQVEAGLMREPED